MKLLTQILLIISFISLRINKLDAQCSPSIPVYITGSLESGPIVPAISCTTPQVNLSINQVVTCYKNTSYPWYNFSGTPNPVCDNAYATYTEEWFPQFNTDPPITSIAQNSFVEVVNNTPQTIRYKVPGTYNLSLTISSTHNPPFQSCNTSRTGPRLQYIKVNYPSAPQASFSINGSNNSTVSVYQNATVNLSYTNIGSTQYFAKTIEWSISNASGNTYNFVGGTNTTSINPQIQFTTPGTYTINQTVTNPLGNSTLSKTIIVQPIAPIANFKINGNVNDQVSVIQGTLINISDNSFNSPSTRLWTISPSTGWNYQSGSSSSSINPTISFTSSGTYTITLTVTNSSGSSAKSKTIIAIPPSPVVNSPIDLCKNSLSSTLNATGSNLKWYTSENGGNFSLTAPLPNTSIEGNYTYYVSQTENNIESNRSLITVRIQPIPSSPIITTPLYICQGASTSALTAIGTNIKWYTNSSGGNALPTPPTPNSSNVGFQTYYLSQTSEFGCESSRIGYQIIVNAQPVAPSAVSPISYCRNSPSSPLNVSGTGLLWYTTSTGGNSSTTTPIPSTVSSGVFNYWVSQTAIGCPESPRTQITVNVSATLAPSAPVVVSTQNYYLGNTSTQLSATGTNLKWYNELVGGNSLTNAPIPSTLIAGNTQYFVSQTVGVCESPKASISVIVSNYPTITTSNLALGSFCIGDQVSIPFSTTSIFQSGNSFVAQLSDPLGSFANPTYIGIGLTSPIISNIPISSQIGSSYRIRVVSSNPAITGNPNLSNITLNENYSLGTAVLDTYTSPASDYIFLRNGVYNYCGQDDISISLLLQDVIGANPNINIQWYYKEGIIEDVPFGNDVTGWLPLNGDLDSTSGATTTIFNSDRTYACYVSRNVAQNCLPSGWCGNTIKIKASGNQISILNPIINPSCGYEPSNSGSFQFDLPIDINQIAYYYNYNIQFGDGTIDNLVSNRTGYINRSPNGHFNLYNLYASDGYITIGQIGCEGYLPLVYGISNNNFSYLDIGANTGSSFPPGSFSSDTGYYCGSYDPTPIYINNNGLNGEWRYLDFDQIDNNNCIEVDLRNIDISNWISTGVVGNIDPPLLFKSRVYAYWVYDCDRYKILNNTLLNYKIVDYGSIGNGNIEYCSGTTSSSISFENVPGDYIESNCLQGYQYRWYYKQGVNQSTTSGSTSGWTVLSNSNDYGTIYPPYVSESRTYACWIIPPSDFTDCNANWAFGTWNVSPNTFNSRGSIGNNSTIVPVNITPSSITCKSSA